MPIEKSVAPPSIMISKMKKGYVALGFMFVFYCFEKYCQIMTSEFTELRA